MTTDIEARELVERLTGFTPEPWSFDAEQGEWPGEALIGGNGDPVLDWDFDLGFQVSESDARLIAAAPDMHRLLTALLAENERLRRRLHRIAQPGRTIAHCQNGHEEAVLIARAALKGADDD